MTKKVQSKKLRIDALMVESGHAPSLEKAAAMVLSGVVLADERRVDKPSEMITVSTTIRIKDAASTRKYVSRGGLKLEHALKEFAIDPAGLHCIDVGSSTGGFTDCLLQHGAKGIVAVDAGTNQLDWRLRSDQRVEVRENTNARELRSADFSTSFDLAVMDVSFISASKVLPALVQLLGDRGLLIVLIKPQFEVARHEVGEGGIVRDAELHRRVVDEVEAFAKGLGLKRLGLVESPILGMEGNKEFLALYEK